MFKTEQPFTRNRKKIAKKAVFETGMPLVKPVPVNQRRSYYKELTLVFGIVVAVIIGFTLWSNYTGGDLNYSGDTQKTPKIAIPVAVEILKKSVSTIRF